MIRSKGSRKLSRVGLQFSYVSPSVLQFFYMLTHLSVNRSASGLVNLSVSLSVYLSVCLSVCQSFYLSSRFSRKWQSWFGDHCCSSHLATVFHVVNLNVLRLSFGSMSWSVC